MFKAKQGKNRRTIKDKVFQSVIFILSFAMVIPLILILYSIFIKGISYLNWDVLINDQRHGGLLNAITGSLILVAIASVIAIPIGILGGVYLSENRNSPLSEAVKILVDVLQGIPSIVIGIIAYVWFVLPMRSFSALSGAIALAIMMLPVVIKNTEETLKVVPETIKLAAYAVGAPYYKVILVIVIPAALSGIVTGILISAGRILGETAPLIFTAYGGRDMHMNITKPMEALGPLIFKYATSPDNDLIGQAWTASLILIIIILVLNISTNAIIKGIKKNK